MWSDRYCPQYIKNFFGMDLSCLMSVSVRYEAADFALAT
jgi:hypothetical protein